MSLSAYASQSAFKSIFRIEILLFASLSWSILGCRHTESLSQQKSLADVVDRSLINRMAIDVGAQDPVTLIVDASTGKPTADAKLFTSSVLVTIEEMDSEEVCARKLLSVKARGDKGEFPLMQIDHGEGESSYIFGYNLNVSPVVITELHFVFEDSKNAPTQCRLSVAGDGHWEASDDIGYALTSDNPARDAAVRAYGSAYEHRLQHYLWHTTRGLWDTLTADLKAVKATNAGPEATEASREREKTLQKSVDQYTAAGWAPPRYFHKDEKTTALSGAGEDFLFMHHQMLLALAAHLKEQGLPMIPAWESLPLPKDTKFPLAPQNFPEADLSEFKTDAYFYEKQRIWEKAYQTPVIKSEEFAQELYERKSKANAVQGKAYTLEDAKKEIDELMTPRPNLKYTGVKGISLSEYGHLLEMTIHNNLHTRFAVEGASRPANTDPLDKKTWDELWSQAYDTPAYDWLGDTYSSHVHPWFYRIHGWIDARIQTWLDANDYKSIGSVTSCKTQPQPCYVWLSDSRYVDKGDNEPWVGPSLTKAQAGSQNSLLQFHAHKAPLFTQDVIEATRGLRAQHATMSRILINPHLQK